MGLIKKTAKAVGKAVKTTAKVVGKTAKVTGKIALGAACPPAGVAMLGHGAVKGVKKASKVYKDKGFVKGTAAAAAITAGLVVDETVSDAVGEYLENS